MGTAGATRTGHVGVVAEVIDDGAVR